MRRHRGFHFLGKAIVPIAVAKPPWSAAAGRRLGNGLLGSGYGKGGVEPPHTKALRAFSASLVCPRQMGSGRLVWWMNEVSRSPNLDKLEFTSPNGGVEPPLHQTETLPPKEQACFDWCMMHAMAPPGRESEPVGVFTLPNQGKDAR